MSVLSDFRTLVAPLFEGRLFRNVAPDLPGTPYARFTRVASVESATLDDNGGTGNETTTRIQIDLYGSDEEVDAKALAVKAALKGWDVDNVVLLERDGYDKDVRLHRSTLDVSIRHQ